MGAQNLDLTEQEGAQWSAMERLAISAGLIQSALSNAYPGQNEPLRCPYLEVGADMEVTPLARGPEGELRSLFELWPNKFGRLAFGFARDHLQMSAPDLLEGLARRAGEEGGALRLGPFEFAIRSGVGFAAGAEPARASAPAHLALCKRMAQTPDWILSELERIERGEPLLGAQPGAGPRRKR